LIGGCASAEFSSFRCLIRLSSVVLNNIFEGDAYPRYWQR
jgi:hypothetical protein